MIVVLDYQFQKKSTKQKPHRYLKGASTLGNGFAGENKAASEVKIRSFMRGSGSTIPGKINENAAANVIYTGAEVSIVRRGVMRPEDVETTPETIRLKTVTGESTPIMGEASVEICIGQLRIRHRTLVANMEDDLIFGMDLSSHRGLTVDPVKEVLRLGNEEFKLNQRCIEAKSVKLIVRQKCKQCDEVEQHKTRFNRRKKAVVCRR